MKKLLSCALLCLLFWQPTQAWHNDIECELEGPPSYLMIVRNSLEYHYLVDPCGNRTLLFTWPAD